MINGQGRQLNHTQSLSGLPDALLDEPRFFEMYGAGKGDTPKGWNNPENWVSAYELPEGSHFGFAMADSNLLLIDFDHVFDPETGEWTERWPRDVYDRITQYRQTYTEISQSGTGLHMVCDLGDYADDFSKETNGYGQIIVNMSPEDYQKLSREEKDRTPKIEIFYHVPRYLFLTGKHDEFFQVAENEDAAIIFNELLKVRREFHEKYCNKVDTVDGAVAEVDDATKAELIEALQYISADSYDTWITVGIAAWNCGLPFEVWKEWSRFKDQKAGELCDKYDEAETLKKWKSFASSNSRWNTGTIFRLARDGGYKKSPVTVHEVNLEMVKTSKIDENGRVIYKPRNCINNMVAVMRDEPSLARKIRYDELARAPKYFGQLPWKSNGDTFGNWTDSDDAHVRALMDSKYGLKGMEMYADAFNIILSENRFNPVIDYLEALPKWDGTPRINKLLADYLGAERNELNAEIMKLTMMGSLARTYTPGCKFDYVLTLVGPQGIGKSKFLCRLASNEEWFDGNYSCLLEVREAVERLRGKRILELAEFASIKRQKDSETVKAFLSNSSDSYREPYARRTTDYKRYCIFTASTNDYSFLTDRTGNRRFLPVECAKTTPTRDLFSDEAREYFNAAWAEALYLFKQSNGKPELILPREMQRAVKDQQERFLEEDPYVGLIQNYLDNPLMNVTCVLDLWQHALQEMGKPKRADSNRIHAIMRNEIKGWHESGRERTSEYGQQRCYRRDEDNEIPF